MINQCNRALLDELQPTNSKAAGTLTRQASDLPLNVPHPDTVPAGGPQP
jgi:hypothetical protein